MANILVVDDSQVERRMVAGMLAQEGEHETGFAENGQQALAAMQRSAPDLVITDIFMPEMNGLELVSAARREFPLVPLVLITSKGNEELAAEALQRGAASYVPKRLLSRYLLDTVRSLLAAAQERHCRARLLGSMQSNTCQFSLENDSRLVPTMVGYLLECMSHIGICDETERLRASVALEEALVNAIHHGNLEVSSELRDRGDNSYYQLVNQRRHQPPYSQRRVHVQVAMTDDEAAFVIRDEGPGFDVAALPDARDPENLEKASGRGVLLMRTFMDEVGYNQPGNQVTMIKRSRLTKAEKELNKVFHIEREADLLIVSVLRNVTSLADENLSRELGLLLLQLQDLPRGDVVIDLKGVSHFGSSFLECLRRIWNAARTRGGNVVLCNVSQFSREILRLSNFDTVWPICQTRQEALASLAVQPSN